QKRGRHALHIRNDAIDDRAMAGPLLVDGDGPRRAGPACGARPPRAFSPTATAICRRPRACWEFIDARSQETSQGSRAAPPTRMNPSAAAPSGALVAGMLLMASSARSHEVAVEQIVRMDLAVQGDRLLVHLQVPATALSDARLPHLSDGTLDGAAMAAVLPIVTAGGVHKRDMHQT